MKSANVLRTVFFPAFVLIVSFVSSLAGIYPLLSYRFAKGDTSGSVFLEAQHQRTEQIQPDHSAARPSPWTHQPICTPHLDVLNSSLCVYTIATFNYDSGISIFTTSSIASSLADLPILISPSTSPLSHPSPPTYRLAAIPGKGHGLLAIHRIPRLTPILTTHPVLLARTEMVLSTQDREHYLRLALSQLPASTQKSYYDLVRLYNIEDFAAQDVVRANSFEIGLPSRPRTLTNARAVANLNDPAHKHTVINDDGSSTVMHLAIFPQAARLNHACNPNAMYHLDSDTLTHVVHATRNIEEGEEITVSYISVMQGLGSRRRMLREGFGFECGCERCEREEGELQEGSEGESRGAGGEERLGRMRSYEAWLKLWVMGEVPTGWQGVEIGEERVEEMIRTYLGMYEEEGLEGFMDEAYKLASAAEWRLGRHAKARQYGRAASEVIGMRYGPKHADVARWSNLNMAIADDYLESLRG